MFTVLHKIRYNYMATYGTKLYPYTHRVIRFIMISLAWRTSADCHPAIDSRSPDTDKSVWKSEKKNIEIIGSFAGHINSVNLVSSYSLY